MESLNPTPAVSSGETFTLALTITDGNGRVHELELIKPEGAPGQLHMHGDNIKLLQRLRMALSIIERNETALF